MSTLALIVAPVGDGAPNRPLDVAVVEDLLNRWPDGRPKLPVDGLATPLRSRTFRDIALEMLEISRGGLHRRARRSTAGEDETYFLDPLFAIAGSGRTPAEELLEDFGTRWGGSVDRIYTDHAY